MKKFALLLLIASVSFTGIAQNAMNNSGFENWANVILIGDQPTGWGGVGLTEETADPFEGTSSALMQTQTYFDVQTQSNDTASGMLAIGVWGNTTPPLTQGESFSGGRPASIDGQYKYTIYSGDTGLVCAWFSRWDGTQRVYLGETKNFVNGVQTSWEAFSYSITWNQLDLADPDSIFIVFASSGAEVIDGESYGNQTPGSSMEVDDISLVDNIGGTVANVNLEQGVSLFPNPASNYVTITEEQRPGSYIMIFDVQGKMLQEAVIKSKNINVSNLRNGNYLYFILDADDALQSRGKFEVVR